MLCAHSLAVLWPCSQRLSGALHSCSAGWQCLGSPEKHCLADGGRAAQRNLGSIEHCSFACKETSGFTRQCQQPCCVGTHLCHPQTRWLQARPRSCA